MFDQAREELEIEYFSRFDYIREAFGPTAIDSEQEAHYTEQEMALQEWADEMERDIVRCENMGKYDAADDLLAELLHHDKHWRC